MIRVGYIAGEPNPWRTGHLDAIALVPDLDLTVIYAAPTVQRRTWTLELGHEAIFLNGPTLPLTRLLHHDYPLTPSIWPLLERERFDVLVIGGWSLMATQLAIVWARLRRVPYLLVAENHGREPRRRWVRAVKRAVLPPVVGGAAGHLVPGTLGREHALAYGAAAATITIFPNTVDVDAVAQRVNELHEHRAELRARLGIDAQQVAVLGVARIVPMKGVDLLVEAAARARERAHRPIRLVHAGAGSADALRDRAAALRLPATFLGELQGDALLEAYAASDVFALLSRRETWGVVVNEAMAARLPVVVTDGVGAAADLVRPGENGEVVPSGDVAAAGRVLAALADDPERRERYGARSRELIRPWGYGPSVDSFAAAVRHAAATGVRRRR